MIKDLERAKSAFESALSRMAAAGFNVGEKPSLSVDPNLEIMGYTNEQDGRRSIVIAGHALREAMLEPLLMHELSHIVLTRLGHPSHDDRLITAALHHYHGRLSPWKISLLANAVNHVQNIYADDILFKASPSLDQRVTQDFFYHWVKSSSLKGDNLSDDRWYAVDIMINNAFAIASLRRRQMLKPKAFETKICAKNNTLLKSVKIDTKTFAQFETFFATLPTKISKPQYTKLLTKFLADVVDLAES